ncbi:hypothetical protein RN001_005921 [Aquatica leii]|uniref:Uncharacterized protein n=1 Tax=Aquatica leii TaxID=1421715 RepID=A0AAN7SI98_9COLE|nr:hypothetical protein RN001_005921 [Aquatica leii]
MKSRRKKELAAEKMNRMATGGGSYKPPTDDEDAVVDDIFSSVDIELKDSLDSDTITMAGVPESKAHPDVSVAAEEESICMPLNACYEAKGNHNKFGPQLLRKDSVDDLLNTTHKEVHTYQLFEVMEKTNKRFSSKEKLIK